MKKSLVLFVLALFLAGCAKAPVVVGNQNLEIIKIENQNANLNKEVEIRDVLLEVPFVVQAPDANWADSKFQDGCEETSILMAKLWLRGEEEPGVDEAKSEIIKISEWEEKNYQSAVDTSAQDTASRLLKEFYGIENYQVLEDVSLKNIKKELSKGNLVIAPMDGQKLGNPNYTAPGPERHMLVIIGYDMDKKEFITNDSGTRKGQGYRYDENVVFEAIRDYPTGNHLPIVGREKNIIVVKK